MIGFLDFVVVVRALGMTYGLSATSWGRSKKRNADVDGHPRSWHLFWSAVDVIPDDPMVLDDLRAAAYRMGLEVIDEGDHWHIEPRG